MNSYRKLCHAALSVITLVVFFCVTATAQGPTAEATAKTDSPTGPLPDTPSQTATSTNDPNWRVAVSIYGWFPGIYGTVGVLGANASIHAPFSDVFHHLKGVIPIAVDAQKGRFVFPVDFFWVKLGDDRAIPLNEFGQTSINLHETESIFTPKFGYRVLDGEHLKVDALAGVRYWHLGQELSLVPSGLSRSQSGNWVDGLGGARFILPLSEKAAVTIAGDAGGGGANLDYQVVGLLTYKFTRKLGLGLGWRYLDVDYRGNHQFIYDVAQTGALAGFYFEFGGKPPVPPTASCSASPTEVTEGDPVTVTATGSNFNPKHTVTYAWMTNGGKPNATDKQSAQIDTTGVAAGSYTANATIADPKVKKGGSATCAANYTVKAKPMNPPQVSCSGSPGTVQSGSPSTITATASSPDNAQIASYSYTSSAGRISGTGDTATLDTTGAPPGAISVTVTATDARNLTGTGACSVSVEVPPQPPTCSKANSIQFPDEKRPWRVDNTAKAILDDVAIRLQSDPNAKVVIVGYADGEKAPMVGTGKNRHPMKLAAQRAVNAKAYLVQDQGIDGSRVALREGTGQQKVADLIWVPQGADENACADLQNTTPVDESVVKPSVNAYPKPRTAAPAHHQHTKAGSTQQ